MLLLRPKDFQHAEVSRKLVPFVWDSRILSSPISFFWFKGALENSWFLSLKPEPQCIVAAIPETPLGLRRTSSSIAPMSKQAGSVDGMDDLFVLRRAGISRHRVLITVVNASSAGRQGNTRDRFRWVKNHQSCTVEHPDTQRTEPPAISRLYLKNGTRSVQLVNYNLW